MKNCSRLLAKWSTLVFMLFATQQIFAQSIITGTVFDGNSNNETLIGGNVIIKGKSEGTVTDIDGKYSIKASPNDVLVFSYIGLESQEITVGNKKQINVTLKASSLMLDEVVAIGYGSVKKSDLTGSVAVVSAKDITKNPSSSAAQALQGKAPGVLVTQGGGTDGGATIRVRGVGSISKSADPIYIVDGIRVGGIDGIQPQDIESLQVLKDASASAIYGADGSNGVIIVTTKRGKSGKVQVNLNSFVSYTNAPKQYNLMTADQYSDLYNAISPNPAFDQAFRERYYGADWRKGTNWQDFLFKDAYSQNHSLSLAGGGEKSNFNVSLGYNQNDGTTIKSASDKISIRANSDFILSKYIKVGQNLSVNNSVKEKPMEVQTNVWDTYASPLMKIYNDDLKGGYESYQQQYTDAVDGSLNWGVPSGYVGTTYLNTAGSDKPNPLAAPSLGDDKSYSTGIQGAVYMQIDFTDWLMFKTSPSLEIINNRKKSFIKAFDGNRSAGNAELRESYSENVAVNLENQLSFKKVFADVHNVQATAVLESRQSTYNSIGGVVTGFNYESLSTLTNGGTVSEDVTGTSSVARRLSYLGRVMYDYLGKYFVTGSYRSDGSSVFSPKYRRAEFWSGSVAWKITEDFLQDIEQLDVMKLRLGWGQTGNSNIGAGFQYLDQISAANNFKPVFGDAQEIANAQYAFYNMASTDVHWESSEMYNAGVDVSMFNSKLQLSAEYYLKLNDGLLVEVPTSAVFGRIDGSGNPAKPWYNIADLQNQGIEISVQWRDQIGQFQYGVNSNLTTIDNRVNYLPVPNITGTNNRTTEGYSIGALYGYVSKGIIQTSDYDGAPNGAGVYDANSGYKYPKQEGVIPQPGDIRYLDLNGDGTITELDRTIIGKTIPSLTYTLGFDCAYKNFDVNVFLFGVSDFQIYNKQRANLSSSVNMATQDNKSADFAENHWTPENQSTTHVRVDVGNQNKNERNSTFWIEDGSFLRVKDIQFGYKLPNTVNKTLGIQSLRVYVSAANILNFTKYSGRDPEPFISSSPLSSGVDGGQNEIPRQFTAGLQIAF